MQSTPDSDHSKTTGSGPGMNGSDPFLRVVAEARRERLEAYAAGLNTIDIRTDGTKRPAGTWKQYQEGRAPSPEHSYEPGYAILTGNRFDAEGRIAPGKVVMLEAEEDGLWERFKATAPPDIREMIERIEAGCSVDSAGGGVHGYVIVPACVGNSKLAERPDPTEDDPKAKATLLETREDRGYVIGAGSGGPTHRTGRTYRRRAGSYETIADLTAEEWEAVRAHARTLGEMPAKQASRQRRRASDRERAKADTGAAPGSSGAWPVGAYLVVLGWTHVGTGSEGIETWRRPGAKTQKTDATVNANGSGGFYVHSSSTGFASGHYITEAEVRRVLEGRGRPVVPVHDGDMIGQGDAILTALERANVLEPSLYRDGSGAPVELFLNGDGALVIRRHDVDSLRTLIADIVRCVMPRKGDPEDPPEPRSVYPPVDLVRSVLGRIPTRSSLPVLRRIVTHPIYTLPDAATLRTEPGYDRVAEVYIDLPEDFRLPPVPTNPTPEEIRDAVNLLGRMLKDFPFVSEADRTAAFALAILPFVRALIRGPLPLFVVLALQPGTGKGLLLQSVAGIVGPVKQTPMPVGDAALGKLILSELRAGSSAIHFDNPNHRIDSGTLAAAITARRYSDRVLGSSTIEEYPMELIWTVAANSPQLSEEMARRSVPLRLDLRGERPDSRRFAIEDLSAWVAEHRPALMGACLTLCNAWIAAGCPAGTTRLPTFEAFSAVMGGIASVAGLPDFLGNLSEFRSRADADTVAWESILEAWLEAWGSDAVTVAQVLQLPVIADTMPLRSPTEGGRRIEFGRRLSQQAGRVYGPLRVTDAGQNRDHVKTYRLEHRDGQARRGDPKRRGFSVVDLTFEAGQGSPFAGPEAAR